MAQQPPIGCCASPCFLNVALTTRLSDGQGSRDLRLYGERLVAETPAEADLGASMRRSCELPDRPVYDNGSEKRRNVWARIGGSLGRPAGDYGVIWFESGVR
jgi:hypothetical protein